MPSKKITKRDKQCIHKCVTKYWQREVYGDDNWRDRSYEQCLTECKIC